MATEASPLQFPYMDIQSNWDEITRNGRVGSKMWVSCREPGKVTEGSDLTKSAGGRLEQSDHCDFAVTGQTSWTVSVSHSKAELTTTFLCPRQRFQLHNKKLLSLDVSGSGGLGVCSSEEGKLWVWDPDTGAVRCNLEGHVGDVYTCQFFPSGIVVLSGGADLRLKIWSAEDGSCPRTFTGHTRGITDTAMIDKGRNIISVSSDGTAKLWDCGSSQCIDTIASAGCPISSCALGSDSSLAQGRPAPAKEVECGTADKLLLLACEDGTLRCSDVFSRQNVLTYSPPNKSPLSKCVFLTSHLVLCGAEDGTLSVLDRRNAGSAICCFQFCESPVRALLKVSDERCLVSYRNGISVMWIGQDYQPPAQRPLQLTNLSGPGSEPITSACASAGCVYSSCRDGSVRRYSLAE